METFNLKELNFSIVNSEQEEVLTKDSLAPFSFLDFIKYLQAEYAPERYSIFYSFYLKQWYLNKETDKETQKKQYNEFYRQFIQEIILSFTTKTEKEFLTKIDYNNPTDLDVVIPFYANKLTEVATFYKNKREDSKYVIDKNKLKGSVTGIERAIFDNIYNYIVNSEDVLLTLGGSISSIVEDFGISVEEYVDVYGDYFDIYRDITDSNTTDSDSQRSDLYNNNVVDIDVDYYFDPNALNVLRNNSFIANLGGFKINPPSFDATSIKSVCDPQDSIFEELNQTFTKGGLTLAEVYTLKRKLINKYISSDFYYIDTTGVVPTSGLLFEAEQPTNNLLNLQTADIAAVQSNEQKLLRDIGLFFKPDDIGIFKLNAVESSFELDSDNLETNKIYIFPDPYIYGNVGVNSLSSYPYLFTFDNRKNIRDISSGVSIGDPKISNKSLTFEPYYSKQRQLQELTDLNTLGYNFNFSDLYNKGKIRKAGYDSFGNEYALFKPANLKTRTAESLDYILSLKLDGHTFFDSAFNEGYFFDYDEVKCELVKTNTGEEVWVGRSGLEAGTNGFSYDVTESPKFLNFRQFTPYEPLRGRSACGVNQFVNDGGLFNSGTSQADSETISGVLKDCVTFFRGDGSPQDDTTLSEEQIINFGLPDGDYYYQDYVTCRGFDTSVGGEIRDEYDAGSYPDNITVSTKVTRDIDINFYNVIKTDNRTQVASINESVEPDTAVKIANQSGNMYVKLQGTSLSYPISSVLGSTLNKYSDTIVADINNNLIDFDVIDDTIFLKTPNGLLIDKLAYTADNTFKTPNTSNTFFDTISSDATSTISDILFVKEIHANNSNGSIFFAIFKTYTKDFETGEELPRNFWSVYPEIYQYVPTTNKSLRVYPQELDQDDLSSFSSGVRFCPALLSDFTTEQINTAKLTYNSYNNKFKLTYIILDQNNLSHINDCLFEWNSGTLTLSNVIKYTPDDLTVRSTTFSDETTYSEINNNSGGYIISNNILTIGNVPL